jgi:hypothetical protein
MLFNGSIQVVLQRPHAINGLVCRCFARVPSPWPSLIVVLPIGGPSAYAAADRAAAAIERFLRSITGTAGAVSAPCGTHSAGPVGCAAHHEGSCRRVLILVGDGSQPFTNDPYGAIPHWASRIGQAGERFVVIPCLPESLEKQAAALLSGPLAAVNVHFWTSDPADIAPAILPSTGIAVNDYRVFISYVRADGQILADQLFDELNRRNFDVFLDQYRIDPGANFQERLMEQLAHKSMVVVLETPQVRASRWVDQEVVYAITNRLGLLAVHVPNGAFLPIISDQRRMKLPKNAMCQAGKLEGPWLDNVCRRISFVHSLAMLRRRHQLLQAMRDVLLNEGIVHQRTTTTGFLEAYPPQRTTGSPFRIWLSPRPAELTDFHYIDLEVGLSNPRPVLISPAASMVGRQAAGMRWLGQTSNIHFFDEADLREVARRIKQDAL